MSRILANLERAFDAQERAGGVRLTAAVGAVSNKDALVSQIDADILAVGGGSADGGGFSLQMRASDFETPPEKFASVQITGRTDTNLVVLRISETGGVYTLTVGDPAANQ